MPYADSDGCRIFYRVSGRRDEAALLLSNPPGMTHRMWMPQMAAFEARYCVVSYDARGQGASDAPDTPYTMQMLGDDAAAVLDAVRIGCANWCGISLGGMTGLWLAANRPGRIGKLVVSNAAAHSDPDTWIARISAVRASGMAGLLPSALGRWVTPAFRETGPPILDMLTEDFLHTSVGGYVGICEALRDMDLRDDLPRIAAPTLVLTGAKDSATTPADAAYLAARIPNARRLDLPAAHIANIEAPELFTRAVIDFLG